MLDHANIILQSELLAADQKKHRAVVEITGDSSPNLKLFNYIQMSTHQLLST